MDADGLVSEQTGTASTADKSKRNYFAVHWDNGVFPTPSDGCAGCELDEASGECKCSINVVESAVTESTRACSYYSVSTGTQIGAPPAVPF